MKKLAICGDSWMTPTLENPNTHFSELLAKHYNCELIALSRGGCSNGAICVQIDQALELNADFIIIGATSSDRIEIPINNLSPYKKFVNYWVNFLGLNYHQEINHYHKKNLLSNFSYDKHPDLSSLNDFMKNPVMISESIANLMYPNEKINNFYNLSPRIIKALNQYVLYLYDVNFKKQIDCWCLSNQLKKLYYEEKINFLFFPNQLYNKEYVKDISWLHKKYFANIEGPYGLEKGNSRYHTSEAAQKYVADQLIKIIDQRF